MKERLPLKQLNQVKEFVQGVFTVVQFALDPRTEPGFQEPRTVVKRERLVGNAEKGEKWEK